MSNLSMMQVICEKETYKKFMGICLEADLIPDETFMDGNTCVLCFHSILWGSDEDEAYLNFKELFDELDGEDEEPYKMLRIGEELADLEERSNTCGSDAYDSEYYIVREFSRRGNHFSR